MAIAEIRQKRVENDIETLRNTQSALMDRIDSFAETLEEVRDIALDNQARLNRIERRLDAVDTRLDSVDTRLDRVEQIAAENRAIMLENRSILISIADHLGLVYEVPPRSPQSD